MTEVNILQEDHTTFHTYCWQALWSGQLVNLRACWDGPEQWHSVCGLFEMLVIVSPLTQNTSLKHEEDLIFIFFSLLSNPLVLSDLKCIESNGFLASFTQDVTSGSNKIPILMHVILIHCCNVLVSYMHIWLKTISDITSSMLIAFKAQ